MIEIYSTDYISKKDIFWKIQKEYKKYQRLMWEYIDKDKELSEVYRHKRDAICSLQDAILKENNNG